MTHYTHCTLCPRNCGADRTKARGFCGESHELRAARASLHLWEEPPISGDVGSGTVFFSGCTLRCIFCQNANIAEGHHGKEITAERLAEIFLELQEKSAANINLVTPTHFLPHIKKALILAKEKGLILPIVYNCGGYEKAETLALLDGLVDIYLPDYKYRSPALAKALSAAMDYPDVAENALREMLRQVGSPVFDENGMMKKGVIVRHLVLPGHTDDSMDVLRFLHENFGDDIYISIMSQYTPMKKFEDHPALSRKLTTYEYQKVVRFAQKIGITRGFLQSGETAKQSFIPAFDLTGI